MSVTANEAYAMHQLSNAADSINGTIGQLRCFAGRVDPDLEDEVQGNVKEYLLALADRQEKNMRRIKEETIMQIGGEERYKELQSIWVKEGISFYHIWKNSLGVSDGEKK